MVPAVLFVLVVNNKIAELLGTSSVPPPDPIEIVRFGSRNITPAPAFEFENTPPLVNEIFPESGCDPNTANDVT
jgi:hypothetical protein